ncbi:MAG: sugar ABC transporter permease [Clostridiales bacterium]|nr:sugar ABC transporter permease [Clostridiales bacterium]
MIKLKQKTRDTVFAWCLLIVPITHFLLFWLYVNIDSVLLAFQHQTTGEWGFDNFTRFFNQFKRDWAANSTIKVAIENTFITAFLNMFVVEPLVIFVAYVLFKKYFGHMFFRVAFYIPGIVGTVVTTIMLGHILDATGPIVLWGQSLGIEWGNGVLQDGLLNNSETARSTFHITAVLGISGQTVLLLTGAYQKIPTDLFDVGRLEGIGMFNEFMKLIVPCSWSTIGVMWVMTFASVWGNYQRVMLLTDGANDTNNFAYYMFASSLNATKGAESYNYPAAMGVLLTAIVAPLTLLLRWLSTKIVPDVEF